MGRHGGRSDRQDVLGGGRAAVLEAPGPRRSARAHPLVDPEPVDVAEPPTDSLFIPTIAPTTPPVGVASLGGGSRRARAARERSAAHRRDWPGALPEHFGHMSGPLPPSPPLGPFATTHEGLFPSSPERVNQGSRWWEQDDYRDLVSAVDQVFAEQELAGRGDIGASQPAGDLVRPFISGLPGQDRWDVDLLVPPPTPVDGVRAAGKPLPSPLPTRRELRQRRRAQTSVRAVTARKIAKGGVLAVTAVGVAATALPELVPGLGLSADQTLTTVAPDALTAQQIGAAQGSAGSPVVAEGAASVDRRQVAELVAGRLAKRQESVQQVSKAGGAMADTVIQLAKAQAAAQKAAEAERARREALKRISRGDSRGIKDIARDMVLAAGWSNAQFTCLNLLWDKESRWNPQARNPSSGAFGIPQALPGSKMASAGSDWQTNPITQVKWGLNYIKERYGSPCGAWDHSKRVGWY